MKCTTLRRRLTERAGPDAAGRAHLRDCPACSRYAERLDELRTRLRDRRLDVEPDPSFAARVAARLPRGPEIAIGRAALRLLPATLAIAVLLALLAYNATPDPESLITVSPTESPLLWIADSNGAGS